MNAYDTLHIAILLGSYGFTWAVYKILSKKIDDILTNHLKHARGDIIVLEAKVDKHKADYDARKHFPH